MNEKTRSWFKESTKKCFVVQFVTSLTVGISKDIVTRITSYLFSADSEAMACSEAKKIIDLLSDSYKNKNGEIVVEKCIGIHSVNEIDYVSDDGWLELGVIQFSQATRPENLIQDERNDLPLLDVR